MTLSIDLPGILLSTEGERHPCRLVDINDKGYLVLISVDAIPNLARLQLLIPSPRIRTVVRVTHSEPQGFSYYLEVIPEESVTNLQAKIVEQKVRGIIK